MTIDWMVAVAAFCFATTWTPGPNNTFLMASGLTFGMRRTVPSALGVSIGFSVMVLAVAFGISRVFQAYPVLQDILRVVSIVYLVWLAWRIATADPNLSVDTPDGARPLSFLEAAGFQWVNPKAWSMALSASAVYVLEASPVVSVLVVALIFLVSGLTSSMGWALGGTALRRLISKPKAVRAINIGLAALLLVSLLPIVRALLTSLDLWAV